MTDPERRSTQEPAEGGTGTPPPTEESPQPWSGPDPARLDEEADADDEDNAGSAEYEEGNPLAPPVVIEPGS